MPKTVPKIKELDRVALTKNLPKHSLKAGDIGTVVDIYESGEGYEVEFCTLTGETIDVVTLYAAQIRPIGQREVPSARRLAS